MESLGAIMPYIQIILSVLLIIGVLIQQSDASLGAIFGGGNDAGGIKRTRRGFEKFLFVGTIVVAILWAITAFLNIVI